MDNSKIINFMLYLFGALLFCAGLVWLGVAWLWYISFPVPYVWLVWATTSPIWFLVSLWLVSGPISNRMALARLKTKGMRIKTKYFNVEMNFMLSVNSRHPYNITSVGINPSTGEKLMFKSQNIWFNPEALMKEGQEIDVIIDPDRPQDHLMDLAFLEQKIKEAQA